MHAVDARLAVNTHSAKPLSGSLANALLSLISIARKNVRTEAVRRYEPSPTEPTSPRSEPGPKWRVGALETWPWPLRRHDAMWMPAIFRWSQYSDHGPCSELLGEFPGRRVIDLGCGSGDNVAHLTFHGAHVTGIDVEPNQVVHAVRRWSWLVAPKTFICADALDYLETTTEEYDCCYSALGAVGHCPTDLLLAAIWRRLRPGGVLAFSVPHVDRPEAGDVPPTHGRTATATTYRASLAIWYELVAESGFAVTYATDLPHPHHPDEACCTILTARRL